jgi:hypothetical protein
VELILMSFDPNNPTALIKDGLVFAAVAKVFQYASDKAADFVSGMPENEDDYYEDEEYE